MYGTWSLLGIGIVLALVAGLLLGTKKIADEAYNWWQAHAEDREKKLWQYGLTLAAVILTILVIGVALQKNFLLHMFEVPTASSAEVLPPPHEAAEKYEVRDTTIYAGPIKEGEI